VAPRGRVVSAHPDPRRKAFLLIITLTLLPGCLLMRVGGSVSHGGDPGQRPVTYNSEFGLFMPFGDGLVGSAMSVARCRTPEGCRPLLGVELARVIGYPRILGEEEDGSRRAGAIHLWGGRLEVGRDDHGRYVGVALAARHFLTVKPDFLFAPSLSLVLSAGAYTGPAEGPAVGLHLLLGNF
jgi:hypothetical protein